MKTSKYTCFLGLLFLAFALIVSSCQGPLDDDISSLFNTFPENASASATDNTSQGESSSSSQNAVENVYKKLVGKWILTKYTFIGEVSETYDEDDDYYVEFYSDYTAYVHPYDLFEDEMGHVDWEILGPSRILLDDSEFAIMQLSSSSLTLGWLDEGKVVEITVFKKAK